MDALVADVLAHNPELRFYEAEVSVAKGQQVSAGTPPNPDVAATVGSKRVTSGGLSDEGVTWSLTVKQPFEWPGRISLRKAIATQQVGLAELGLEQFKSALASQARILAYNLAAARENASAAKEVADRLQTLREVLVQREPAGLAPILETRIIEATELTLERRASEAAIAENEALLQLNQLRGRPWTDALSIVPPDLSFDPPPSVEALFAAADRNNFELQVRRAELRQQGLKVSLSKNEAWPAVALGPYVFQEHAGDVETQAGLSLSVPLPVWNRNAGAIAAESAREIQATTSLVLGQRQVERQIADKAFVYKRCVEELGRWKADAIRQFKDAAALADQHYRLGAVPIAIYVELQKQYLDAVTALLDARRSALVAQQELALITGVDISKAASRRQGADSPLAAPNP
jgi:cobalt-zinc-cadmium efflux system outer membrane protein